MNIVFQFLVVFVFISILVGIYKFLLSRQDHKSYKHGVWVLLFGCLLLFWINGAVGIIGSENNDANLMFVCVPGLGFIVATLGRFSPISMKHALLTMAGIQLLIAVVALVFSLGTGGNSWPKDVIGATVIFISLWLLAAGRFQAAISSEGQSL